MNPAIHDDAHAIARWIICGVVVLAVHIGLTLQFAKLSNSTLAGAPEGAVMLDLDSLPGATPGESGTIVPENLNRELPVAPDVDVKEEKKEAEQPPEPAPEPPQVQKNAEVALPMPQQHVQKPQKKRLPTPGAPSPNEGRRAAGDQGDLRSVFNRTILAHINSHKGSPTNVPAEVVVTLSFTVDRQGKVLAAHIVKGSGLAELDRWALDMIRRAQPFPSPPGDLAGSQFPFTLPIRYNQR